MANDDRNVQYLWWMIFCISSLIIIFIYHLFKIIQSQGFDKSSRLSAMLSLALIIFGMIGIIVFIVTIHIIGEHPFCIFAAHWGPTGYSIFKLIMYCILVLRFNSTFKGTAVQYDQKKLKIWVSILFIWTSANLVGINMTAENLAGKCEVARPPLPMIASIALIDMVACVTNTVLFTRPLIKLNRSSGGDLQLKYLAVKQCVLTIIAIVSTIISLLIVAMANLYVFSITMDYVVSALCIILMYKWNSGCIERCFFCCVHHTSSTLSDVKNLEASNKDQSTLEMPSTTLPDRPSSMVPSVSSLKDVPSSDMPSTSMQTSPSAEVIEVPLR